MENVTRTNNILTIKLAVSYILAWVLYFIGDCVSNLITDYTVWLYPLYNNCMGLSYDIQKWGNAKSPWTDSK